MSWTQNQSKVAHLYTEEAVNTETLPLAVRACLGDALTLEAFANIDSTQARAALLKSFTELLKVDAIAKNLYNTWVKLAEPKHTQNSLFAALRGIAEREHALIEEPKVEVPPPPPAFDISTFLADLRSSKGKVQPELRKDPLAPRTQKTLDQLIRSLQ